jgi:predicted DNA-binding transcriptional regulator AlpA
MPNLITTSEFAEIVRAPEETVRYWRFIGKGPRSVKLGRRVLYDRDDVEQWIAEQRTEQSSGRGPEAA